MIADRQPYSINRFLGERRRPAGSVWHPAKRHFRPGFAIIKQHLAPCWKRLTAVVLIMLTSATAVPADICGSGANQITVDFLTISGATNPASGYGIVSNDFRISKYKITKAQWDTFTAGLGVPVTGTPWHAYDAARFFTAANVPINNVSWYQAAQFVNWLNTSTGHHAAYKFTGTQGTSDCTFATWSAAEAANGTNLYRHKDAFYFLPTEHEWVKAAYWNGSSIQAYATKAGESLTQGNGVGRSGWNFYNSGYATTTPGPWPVGSGSLELNGTFDMMGSAWEWMESPNNDTGYGAASTRALRGGSFSCDASAMASSARGNDLSVPLNGDPGHGYDYDVSFRVASLAGTPLVWTGTTNGIWDINTTANFSGSASGKYAEGDYVTFDTSGTNTTVQIAAGGVTPRSLVFSNAISKDYSLSGGPIKGQTAMTIAGGGRVTLSGTNTFTGGTTVSAGTLLLGSQAGIADNTAMTITGGSLDLGGFTKTTTTAVSFQGGSTTNGSIIHNGTAYDAQAGSVAAALQGSAGLNKTGAGTLTLSGTNNYSGPTTVSGGILELLGSINPSGAVSVLAAAGLSGTGSMGSLTVAAGGHLRPGSGGTLSTSAMNLNAGSILDFSGGQTAVSAMLTLPTAPGSVIVNLGTSLPPGTYTLFNYATLTTSGGNPWNPQSTFVMGSGTGNYLYTFTNPAGSIRLVIAPPPAVTWTGGGSDTNWSRAANWSPVTSLGGSEALTFAGSGGTTNNDVTSGQFKGITFASGAAAFTLNGNAVDLTSDVTNNSSSLQTIDLNLSLQQATIFTTNGSGGDLAIGGIIAGGPSASLTKSGSGTLVLSGGNTYTGSTLISGGILRANNATALGAVAGSITFGGGTLQFTAASAGQDWGSRIKYSTAGSINLDTNGQVVTLAGVIDASNTAGLTKLGQGTLNLSAANNFAGGTVIQAGTVNASGASPFGTGSLTVNNLNTGVGTAVVLNLNSSLSSGSLSGTLALPASASNTLALNIASGQTYTVNQSADGNYPGSINGTGSLAKAGSNQLTLSGANTYTGTTTVNAGILKAGGVSVTNVSGAFGNNSAVTLANVAGAALDITGFDTRIGSLAGGGANGGNVTLGSATLTVGGNNTSTSYAGVISGSGNLNKSGTGMLILQRANSYTGKTVIDGGTLAVDESNGSYPDSKLGAVPASFQADNISLLNGATLYRAGGNDGAASISSNRGIYLGPGTQYMNQDAGDTAINGVISGPGGLYKLRGNSYSILILSAANTYTGDTKFISSGGWGYIRLGNPLALQNSAFDTSGSTNLDWGGQTAPVFGGLVGGNNLNVAGSVTSLTLNPTIAGVTKTYTGVLSGAAGMTLTKTGAGTQVLGGANTYSGTTTVSNGSLLVNNPGGSGTGTGIVNVNGGASLGGTGAIAGTVNVTGVLVPGGPVIESLSCAALNLNNLSTFACQVDSSVARTVGADLQKVTGNLGLNGTVTLTLTNIAAASTAFTAGTTFSLLNYSGIWNGGLFKYGAATLADGGKFDFNSQQWIIDYDATSAGANFGAEQTSGKYVTITLDASVDPYTAWTSLKGLTSGNNATALDPDGDGASNLAEFAFNGNPLSAVDRGKVYSLTVDSNGDASKDLVLTLAVRAGAVFTSGNPGPATASINGLSYTIEGSTDLSAWTGTVKVVDPAIITNLPVLTDPNYKYATFSLSGSGGLPAKGYLRAKASQ